MATDTPGTEVLGKPGGETALGADTVRARSQWSAAWHRFKRNRLALAGLIFCALLILVALITPLLAPHDFDKVDLLNRLAPAGSPDHLLGTDVLGRDILSRLLYGLRTALMVGFGAEITALAVALVIGLAAGYLGGRVESALMAFTDVMYAFPAYLFAVVLVTVLGRSTFAVILAIGIASWVTQARLVRAQVLSLKQREYVEAARAMGAGGVTIAVKYILPNAIGPILVTTSFAIPAAIAAEAGLAILGLGIQGSPSWGFMIAEGSRSILSDPNLLVWPALLFGLTLLAFTWLGDGIRDAFDTSGEER